MMSKLHPGESKTDGSHPKIVNRMKNSEKQNSSKNLKKLLTNTFGCANLIKLFARQAKQQRTLITEQ